MDRHRINRTISMNSASLFGSIGGSTNLDLDDDDLEALAREAEVAAQKRIRQARRKTQESRDAECGAAATSDSSVNIESNSNTRPRLPKRGGSQDGGPNNTKAGLAGGGKIEGAGSSDLALSLTDPPRNVECNTSDCADRSVSKDGSERSLDFTSSTASSTTYGDFSAITKDSPRTDSSDVRGANEGGQGAKGGAAAPQPRQRVSRENQDTTQRPKFVPPPGVPMEQTPPQRGGKEFRRRVTTDAIATNAMASLEFVPPPGVPMEQTRPQRGGKEFRRRVTTDAIATDAMASLALKMCSTASSTTYGDLSAIAKDFPRTESSDVQGDNDKGQGAKGGAAAPQPRQRVSRENQDTTKRPKFVPPPGVPMEQTRPQRGGKEFRRRVTTDAIATDAMASLALKMSQSASQKWEPGSERRKMSRAASEKTGLGSERRSTTTTLARRPRKASGFSRSCSLPSSHEEDAISLAEGETSSDTASDADPREQPMGSKGGSVHRQESSTNSEANIFRAGESVASSESKYKVALDLSKLAEDFFVELDAQEKDKQRQESQSRLSSSAGDVAREDGGDRSAIEEIEASRPSRGQTPKVGVQSRDSLESLSCQDGDKKQYSIGDTLRSKNDIIRDTNVKRILQLNVLDFCMVRRSRGRWTCSVVRGVNTENEMVFELDAKGRTKKIEKNLLLQNVRRLKNAARVMDELSSESE